MFDLHPHDIPKSPGQLDFSGRSAEVKVITILSVPILLLIIIGAVSNTGVSSQSSEVDRSKKNLAELRELQNAPDQGSIDWFLRRAKLIGEKEVILPRLHICGPDVPDLNTALSEYDVIAAESIERYVQPHQVGLLTWYKFRIVEDLSAERRRECSTCGDAAAEQREIPAQLLPLAPDEIVVPCVGGELEIDRVRFIQPHSLSVDFSTGLLLDNNTPAKSTGLLPYKRIVNRQTFLMFLSLSRDSKIAALPLGDAGVFSCDGDGELTSFGASGSITLNLAKYRIHSLATLREYRKR